ncbi:hypothetical protein ACFY12_14100 [Streptomyces sp. NPDC001339]|uniref:hypothetical protein n=1 Tax=Streptomyces sp. NPDC001339 TaxID=3364563 RepID=UPI003678828D
MTGLRTAVARTAGWSARHPWPALSLWLGIVVVSATAGALALDTPVDEVFGDASGGHMTWYVAVGSGTVLLLLIALFAAVAPGLVSLLVTLGTVAAAAGWWAVAARLLPDLGPSASVLALVAVLGTALAVTHCVLYLLSERQARRLVPGRPRATGTVPESSRTVLCSGGVTITVACGLYVPGDAPLASVATGVVLTMAALMTASITVLPAVSARFGRYLDRPRLPFLWRLTYRLGPPRLWPLLLRPSVRCAGWTLAGAVVLHAVSALPLVWWQPRPPGEPAALRYDITGLDGCGSTALNGAAMASITVLLAFAALAAVSRSAPAAAVVTIPAALSAVSACGLSTPLLWLTEPEQILDAWEFNASATWPPLLAFVSALAVSVLLLRGVVLRAVALRTAGMAPSEAAARAVAHASDGMTFTAVVLCAVFLLGACMGSAAVGQLCVVPAVSVVLTVTLVRALTLPSLIIVMAKTRRVSPCRPATGVLPPQK